jgi:arylsulfatase A-like enzyme
MVNYADAAVGNVTKLFKSKGMWDDLVMVFSTDNGESRVGRCISF